MNDLTQLLWTDSERQKQFFGVGGWGLASFGHLVQHSSDMDRPGIEPEDLHI